MVNCIDSCCLIIHEPARNETPDLIDTPWVAMLGGVPPWPPQILGKLCLGWIVRDWAAAAVVGSWKSDCCSDFRLMRLMDVYGGLMDV